MASPCRDKSKRSGPGQPAMLGTRPPAMNILLLGKHGQLGFELQRALAPVGKVTAAGREQCDLTHAADLRRTVRKTRPDVIVNAAAYTAVDRAESETDLAYAINAEAPAVLAAEAAASDALLIHYSTDYVFAGNGSNFYAETDAPDPVNVYGASKLAGEQAIQASAARSLILRTSWVMGAHGRNFLKTMLRLASEKTALDVVADQFGAPTSTALLADVSAHMIRTMAAGPTGAPEGEIYHLAAGGVTSWHELASHIIEQARRANHPVSVAPDAITPIATADWPTPARRPANSRLDTHKIRQHFAIRLPEWQHGVDHILAQILQNDAL